jgi:hypothetical protein
MLLLKPLIKHPSWKPFELVPLVLGEASEFYGFSARVLLRKSMLWWINIQTIFL